MTDRSVAPPTANENDGRKPEPLTTSSDPAVTFAGAEVICGAMGDFTVNDGPEMVRPLASRRVMLTGPAAISGTVTKCSFGAVVMSTAGTPPNAIASPRRKRAPPMSTRSPGAADDGLTAAISASGSSPL